MTNLDAFLEQYRDTPFDPGEFDCALFVSDWIAEITGEDPARDFRQRYSSVEEGLKLLLIGLEDAAAQLMTEVPNWMTARPGDVAIIDIGGTPAFGLVGRGGIHVLAERGGLAKLRLDRAVRVFRP